MDARDLQLVKELKNKTGKYLVKIENAITKRLSVYSDSPLYDALLYAVEGGKRIRPLILMLSWEATGEREGNKSRDPLAAAVAVELLHTESIIHDDILDHETSRRNKVVFHLKYGYGTSLLTADFVFGIILDIASRYKDARVAKELSSAALRMCEGEFSELKIDPTQYMMDWKEYITLISQKTASLFQTSAKLGATIGFGTDKEIGILSEYGLKLGIAYQIRDDIIDWGQKGKVTQALSLNPAQDVLEYLHRKSQEYALEAKHCLSGLHECEGKSYLERLTHLTNLEIPEET